jgi:glycosyltransferase involved in cell wall biosynthesis
LESGGETNAKTGLNPAKSEDPSAIVDSLRDRLHALVVCLSHSWGGLEQVAANDAIDVGALGLNVQVLCLRDTPIHQALAEQGSVGLVPLDFQPRNYFDFKLKACLEELTAKGVNLIHTHQTSILGSIAPWLWKRRSVALLASRHIMSNHDKRDFFHRMIYGRLDGLMVVSQTIRQNVLDTHPIRDRLVKVVNLGLDFDVFDPTRVHSKVQRAKWGADPQTVVIGLVGRIDPAKGQDTFIKAAAGLLKSHREGEKFKFVIVGEETRKSPSNYLDELKAVIAQFRLGDHVVFAGFQKDIHEVMGAFDIFVMPSHREAFGLVAIEAMAMECPIVISTGGSADEIVGNQEFGLTMRPDDAFDLQRQLRYLLDNPELRIKMGKAAREHVKRHYDRRTRLRKTLEIYERALRRRGVM